MVRHAPGFLRLVDAARTRIREIEADELAQQLSQQPDAVLLDVREADEYAAGHVAGAAHLGKGGIERDIAARHPDLSTPLYLYCGGGYRSSLAADALTQMGYRNVVSVNGGWRALQSLMPTTGPTAG